MGNQARRNWPVVLIIALLTANLLAVLFKGDSVPILIAPQVQAGGVAVVPGGGTFTCSPDGRTLYVWYNDRAGIPLLKLEAAVFKVQSSD